MPDLVYVLRWQGFERVLRQEKPLHETMIEMTLGEHIVDRVVGDSGAPHWIPLWVFEFKEVDAEGRRVYEATADPYESEFELYEQQKLAQWRLTARKLRATEVQITEKGREYLRRLDEKEGAGDGIQG